MADNKAIVLIVDDEQPTRELERRILASSYDVLEASGAGEAFNLLATGQRLDLVISDLEMPELAGEEMVVAMRAARPGLKVLYVSGVTDRLLDARPMLGPDEAFLSKPFTAKGLLEAVSLLVYGTLTPPGR